MGRIIETNSPGNCLLTRRIARRGKEQFAGSRRRQAATVWASPSSGEDGNLKSKSKQNANPAQHSEPNGSGQNESAPTAGDLFSEHQKQAWASIQSSSDEYDKSILTLSSGGLGLSLAFIKDIVPLNQAIALPLLYCSWVAFTLSIIITVFSFRLSVLVHENYLDNLYKYYIERKEECYNKGRWADQALETLAWLAGGLFVVAVIMTIMFARQNITALRLHKP